MTGRESFELEELRLELFEEANWMCRVCGRPLSTGHPQLAHRIPQNKQNLRRLGAEIVHHRLNLVPVERLSCNSAVSLQEGTADEAALVARIREALAHDR